MKALVVLCCFVALGLSVYNDNPIWTLPIPPALVYVFFMYKDMWDAKKKEKGTKKEFWANFEKQNETATTIYTLQPRSNNKNSACGDVLLLLRKTEDNGLFASYGEYEFDCEIVTKDYACGRSEQGIDIYLRIFVYEDKKAVVLLCKEGNVREESTFTL